MSERTEQAKANFKKGYNCAQAVLVTFADVLGVTEAEAAAFSSPFGAGYGRIREVCGAVSSMTMLLGYLEGNPDPEDQEAKTRIYVRERELAGLFIKAHGSMICREILGLLPGQEEPPEPGVRTEEYYKSRPCMYCIETAARIIEEELLSKHSENIE